MTLAAGLASGTASLAWGAPATFTANVTGPGGTPLAGLTVCVTQNNRIVGGAKLTNDQGRAAFDALAEGTYQVYFLKEGFSRTVSGLLMSGADRTIPFTLSPGTMQAPSGVQCVPGVTGAVVAIARDPVRITNFKVNGGVEETTSRDVTLTASFDRTPAYYRAGESPEAVAQDSWQPFRATVPMTYRLRERSTLNEMFGQRTVMLQVATSLNTAPSGLAADGVRLVPARISIHTVTGADLTRFLERAAQVGYRQALRFESNIGASRCPPGAFGMVEDGAQRWDGVTKYTEKIFFAVLDGDQPLARYWKLVDLHVSKPGYAGHDLGIPVDVTSNAPRPPIGGRYPPFRFYTFRRAANISTDEVTPAVEAPTAGRVFGVPVPDPSRAKLHTKAFVRCHPHTEPPVKSPQVTSISLEGPDGVDILEALRR